MCKIIYIIHTFYKDGIMVEKNMVMIDGNTAAGHVLALPVLMAGLQ